MNICLVTGSSGLIGSESVVFFSKQFDLVIGIDNNMRSNFFGQVGSTELRNKELIDKVKNYEHFNIDIRDSKKLKCIFDKYRSDIKLIVHTAAQPSHDWASKYPSTDFEVNANGTLNLLEMTRKFCDEAVFIFTSSMKIYGDKLNSLPFVEMDKRWEIAKTHQYYKNGIDELMSIDQTRHTLFGASKLSADILVQEYGRYYNLNTGIFRCGCISGPNHSGTKLHGFLSYLMKCAVSGEKYTIFGFNGKQVRDNIHSKDLVRIFELFYLSPKKGVVYNIGGGRDSNCSILEAIEISEKITKKTMNYKYSDSPRVGDVIWWISDMSKFKNDYPSWSLNYNSSDILNDIFLNIKSSQ